MQSSTSSSAQERGIVLILVIFAKGIIGILVASLLPALQLVADTGSQLQQRPETATLGARLVAEAKAVDDLRGSITVNFSDAGDDGAAVARAAVIQLPELRARLASVLLLRAEVQARCAALMADGFIADPIVGLLLRAEQGLGAMLDVLNDLEQSLFGIYPSRS